MIKTRRTVIFFLLSACFLFAPPLMADDCPVAMVNPEFNNLDEEFGAGTQQLTRCLEKRKIKVVYQANKFCRDTACSKAYLLGNIKNAIADYKITHGIPDKNIDINVVVHSGGWNLIVNDTPEHPNPFVSQVNDLLAKGVKFYFCQNTARSHGLKTSDLIPGVGYVTSGVTAIADFQLLDYGYVQP